MLSVLAAEIRASSVVFFIGAPQSGSFVFTPKRGSGAPFGA